jgi:hypothetical protein
MLLSRDGETPRLNNGTSMVSPRLSRTTTGNLIHLISNPMVDQPISDVPLPTQDGGKSLEMKEDSLPMKKERLLKSKIKTRIQMLKTEISWSTIKVTI